MDAKPPETDIHDWLLSRVELADVCVGSQTRVPLDEWVEEFQALFPGDDAQLLVQEVLEVLQSTYAKDPRGFFHAVLNLQIANPLSLERIASFCLAPSYSDLPDTEQDQWKLLFGTTVGGYTLYHAFQQTGQGRAFHAYRWGDKHSVIIKVLPLDAAEDAPRAFRPDGEAERLRRLPRHPGLVPYIDAFQIPLGLCLVTEFIDGDDLETRCRRGWPTDKALGRLAGQLIDALAAAHAARVYHGDLKPSNLIVENAGEEEQIRVIDFGLGMFDGSSLPDFIEQACPRGTQGWMPPELAIDRNSPEPIDWQACDVFGVCAILYSIAVGRRANVCKSPFPVPQSSHSVDYPAYYEEIDRHLQQSTLPPEVQSILRRGLSRDPRRRQASLSMLQEQLTTAAPDLFSQPSDWPALAHRWQSHAYRFALVASALVALAAIGVAAYLGKSPAPPTIATVDQAWTDAARAANFDLTQASSQDFTLTLESASRGAGDWSTRATTPEHRATLWVSSATIPYDALGYLQARFSGRSWKYANGDLATRRVSFLLDDLDLEAAGPLEFRFGDVGAGAVGPFLMDLDVKQELLQDEMKFLKDRIAACLREDLFDLSSPGWDLAFDIEHRFGDLIQEVRFGTTPNQLDFIARAGDGTPGRIAYRDGNERPPAITLRDAFRLQSLDLQASPVLWIELRFVDGSRHGPFHYKKANQFGHDGELGSARERLPQLEARGSLARARERLFVLDGLASIAAALRTIHLAEAGKPAALSYTVINRRVDSQQRAMSYIDNPWATGAPTENARHLTDQLLAFDWLTGPRNVATEITVFDGLQNQAVLIPPLWREIDVVVTFTDGTTSQTYRIQNELPQAGFETELLQIDRGQMALPIYVVARQPHLPGNEPSRLFPGAPRPQLTRLELFPLPSLSCTEVKFFEDPDLQNPLGGIAAGQFSAAFYDKDGQRLGSATYRIDTGRLAELTSTETPQ